MSSEAFDVIEPFPGGRRVALRRGKLVGGSSMTNGCVAVRAHPDDFVVAADTTVLQDSVHFQAGGVPGDGVHVLWPLWLGPNRGRQFLLMGQEIDAHEALELGLVAEVLPADQVLDRAWEIARDFARRPRLTLRYTRRALTLGLRRALDADLDEGLALEFLGRAFTRTGTGPPA